MKKERNLNIRRLVLSGLFIAIIFVLTAYLHIPTAKGYIHIGDAMIFLSASLLPTPYAIAVSAIGGALADALSGYWIWVPATAVIKGLTALFFTSNAEKILCKRNITAIIPALIICVGGYGLYSGIFIYQNLIAGFIAAPANAIQVIASSVLYVVSGLALDRAKMKKKIGI